MKVPKYINMKKCTEINDVYKEKNTSKLFKYVCTRYKWKRDPINYYEMTSRII